MTKPSSQLMKIGFAQFCPILGDPQTNLQRVMDLAPAMSDADLIVLPELANSGYHFSSREQAMALAVNPENAPFVDTCIQICREQNLIMITGINERSGDDLYNSSLLLDSSGILGTYRKQHLFMDEKDFFEPGNLGFPVFEVNGVRIGMLICFDWIFPEAWRIMALEGADIICHPSNLVIPGLAQMAVPVRAVENRIFVITANRIGTEDQLTFTGLSTIANPKGEIICQAGQSAETVKWVEVDILQARDKMVTRRNHVLTDRRPDTYGQLCVEDNPGNTGE